MISVDFPIDLLLNPESFFIFRHLLCPEVSGEIRHIHQFFQSVSSKLSSVVTKNP